MLFWIMKVIAYIPFWLLYPIRIKKFNKIPKGKCIFIANHLSNIDPLIMVNMFWRKQFVLSKKELFKKPLLRAFLKGMNAIPIDRDNVEIKTIKQCLNVLKNNKTLTLFPEGTRNKTNNLLLEIKNGTGIFAARSNAPVVPMWFKKKPKLFCFNTLYVGEPFFISKDNVDNSGEIIRDNLIKLREKSLNKKNNRA